MRCCFNVEENLIMLRNLDLLLIFAMILGKPEFCVL